MNTNVSLGYISGLHKLFNYCANMDIMYIIQGIGVNRMNPAGLFVMCNFGIFYVCIFLEGRQMKDIYYTFRCIADRASVRRQDTKNTNKREERT